MANQTDEACETQTHETQTRAEPQHYYTLNYGDEGYPKNYTEVQMGDKDASGSDIGGNAIVYKVAVLNNRVPIQRLIPLEPNMRFATEEDRKGEKPEGARIWNKYERVWDDAAINNNWGDFPYAVPIQKPATTPETAWRDLNPEPPVGPNGETYEVRFVEFTLGSSLPKGCKVLLRHTGDLVWVDCSHNTHRGDWLAFPIQKPQLTPVIPEPPEGFEIVTEPEYRFKKGDCIWSPCHGWNLPPLAADIGRSMDYYWQGTRWEVARQIQDPELSTTLTFSVRRYVPNLHAKYITDKLKGLEGLGIEVEVRVVEK
jgi:hypothetical protein